TVIEPLVSEQWWLQMDEMRDRAVDASEAGKVRWHPERYERTYLDWLRGLRDWNIGRQLWLGHRVPVYHCDNGHVVVSVDPPGDCPECGSTRLTQDPDVLDTWFSSALWPFATLGWPDETEDLEAFYPTDMNCTPPAESPGMLEAREHLEDRWILSRLSVARRDVTAGIDGFAFQDSINAAYGFAWNEFCDWYLESIKERLRAGDAAAQDVAYFCLDNLMRLLHPFMPFVTEELWSRLPGDRGY